MTTVEITLPELLKRVDAGQIPMDAKVRVTFDDAEAPSVQVTQDPTLALFEQWAIEDEQLTPEQEADNKRVYAAIETNGIPRVRI